LADDLLLGLLGVAATGSGEIVEGSVVQAIVADYFSFLFLRQVWPVVGHQLSRSP